MAIVAAAVCHSSCQKKPEGVMNTNEYVLGFHTWAYINMQGESGAQGCS